MTKKNKKLLSDSKKLLKHNPPRIWIEWILATALTFLIKIIEKDK